MSIDQEVLVKADGGALLEKISSRIALLSGSAYNTIKDAFNNESLTGETFLGVALGQFYSRLMRAEADVFVYYSSEPQERGEIPTGQEAFKDASLLMEIMQIFPLYCNRATTMEPRFAFASKGFAIEPDENDVQTVTCWAVQTSLAMMREGKDNPLWKEGESFFLNFLETIDSITASNRGRGAYVGESPERVKNPGSLEYNTFKNTLEGLLTGFYDHISATHPCRNSSKIALNAEAMEVLSQRFSEFYCHLGAIKVNAEIDETPSLDARSPVDGSRIYTDLEDKLSYFLDKERMKFQHHSQEMLAPYMDVLVYCFLKGFLAPSWRESQYEGASVDDALWAFAAKLYTNDAAESHRTLKAQLEHALFSGSKRALAFNGEIVRPEKDADSVASFVI